MHYIIIILIVLGILCGINDACESCSREDYQEQVRDDIDSYTSAVNNNDFAKAHTILDKLYNNYLESNAENYECLEEFDEYWTAADYIYKAEMVYLISQHDPAANKRMLLTLANMNVIGEKPELGDRPIRKKFNYIKFIGRYNRLCDEILNISLFEKNEEMAKDILKLYKEDISYEEYDYNSYKFAYTSRDKAKAKYEEAVKNGDFK